MNSILRSIKRISKPRFFRNVKVFPYKKTNTFNYPSLLRFSKREKDDDSDNNYKQNEDFKED